MFPFDVNIRQKKMKSQKIRVYCKCRRPHNTPMMKCQNCCEWFHARCIESPDDVNAPFVNFVMQIITQILTDNKGTIAVYNTERMLSEHS